MNTLDATRELLAFWAVGVVESFVPIPSAQAIGAIGLGDFLHLASRPEGPAVLRRFEIS